MPILPIQAVGALVAAAPLAEAAVSGVSQTFAQLLKAVTSPEANEAANSSPLSAIGLDTPKGAEATHSPTSKLRGQTESLLRQFHQLLTEIMGEGSFGADGRITLQSGDAGKIAATGSNVSTSQVQELVSSRPELSQLFDKIVANVNLLRLAEESRSAGSPVSLTVDASQASVKSD